ncbi:MAG TPA: hypothetical protein VE692_03940 [Nitrososphaera sp.]|nr:hypothetical protein [Nitrososphaera sp.]
MVKSIADFEILTNYLDGFLSSVRSVTCVLQKEFSSKTGFREWVRCQKKSVDPENDFDLFVNLRNTSIKERNIYPNPSISATDTIHYTDSCSARLYDKNGKLIKEVIDGAKTSEIPKAEKR